MGQKLQDDKTVGLSHSAGVITLGAGSIVTIGGQQYTLSANVLRTITDDVTLSANGLYMIFAVISGGSVALRISSNFNSVGPAGFTSWALVGAFYANALATPTFGTFINVTGVPVSQTGWTGINTASTTVFTGTGSNPTLGTVTRFIYNIQRNGPLALIHLELVQTAAGATGTGDYIGPFPTNLLLDTANQQTSNANVGSVAGPHHSAIVGFGMLSDIPTGTRSSRLFPFAHSTTQWRAMHDFGGVTVMWNSANNNNFSSANINMTVDLKFYVQGWTNTQLKDL